MSTTVGPHVGRASNENVCTGGSRAGSPSLMLEEDTRLPSGKELREGVPQTLSKSPSSLKTKLVLTNTYRQESLDNCDGQKVSGGDKVEVGVVEDVLVLHPIADHAK